MHLMNDTNKNNSDINVYGKSARPKRDPTHSHPKYNAMICHPATFLKIHLHPSLQRLFGPVVCSCKRSDGCSDQQRWQRCTSSSPSHIHLHTIPASSQSFFRRLCPNPLRVQHQLLSTVVLFTSSSLKTAQTTTR
jgi:hypothetical protein